MAITILNPARFNDDGGVGGRQYIRAAFFDEGYGVSESFKAYAQGAGIVPATSGFNIIGAGTVPDPLRMSQFNGFVVPSLSETQTVTVGVNIVDIEEPFLYLEFYGYAQGGIEFGSISDGTFELISNATILQLFWLSNDTLTFTLAGNRANSGWSTVVINSITFNRSAATYSYDSGTNTTSWYWEMIGSNPFGTTEGITRAAVFTP